MPGAKAPVPVICLFALQSTFHLTPALLDTTGVIMVVGSWLVLANVCVSLKFTCQNLTPSVMV